MYFLDKETIPPLLRETLQTKGWKPTLDPLKWNLWWKGSRFRHSDYTNSHPWQRLNHFPKSAVITRKDSLFRCLRTMRTIYGSLYDFFPQTFVLPTDFKKFIRVYAEQEENKKKSLWICKPTDMSRGRGIFVFNDIRHLNYDCQVVLQKYISNPLLINGYKFDLRCYVVVVSYHPLIVYFYGDGLVRFATVPYTTETTSLSNLFTHLTNTSINKNNPTLDEKCKDGCKWDFGMLKKELNANNIRYDSLMDNVKTVIVATLLPVAHLVPKNSNSFELYGFDILIDEKLKPWLLEVNFSPALTIDYELDIKVKKPLLNDLIDVLAIPARETCMNATQTITSYEDVKKQIAVKGVLIECDEAVKQVILNLNETNRFLIEDLDDKHVFVDESCIETLQKELNKLLEQNTFQMEA